MNGAPARQGWRMMLAGAALAALAMSLAPARAYALPVCTTTISSCCKITSADNYGVSGDFTASGSYGACIKIQAPNVVLNGNGHTITGPGATSTMKGVVIEPGADNGGVESLTMSTFDTGIEVDANQAILALAAVTFSGTGIVVNGKKALVVLTGASFNTNNGMVINGKAFTAQIFGGFNNGANGVVFNSTAVGAYAVAPEGNNNVKTGVKIKGLNGGWFQQALAEQNGTYGVWLRGTNAVSLSDFTVKSNGIAGVYLGCHGDGPSNASCAPGISPTNANNVTSTNLSTPASTANAGSGQQYGVAIDIGNYLNHVGFVTADANSVNDGYDGNPGCASNVWVGNTFTSTNQSCVH